jgi:hypothetical protein
MPRDLASRALEVRHRHSASEAVLEDHARSRQESKLSEHREAIALLDAMIQQVLEDYEEGGTGLGCLCGSGRALAAVLAGALGLSL